MRRSRHGQLSLVVFFKHIMTERPVEMLQPRCLLETSTEFYVYLCGRESSAISVYVYERTV